MIKKSLTKILFFVALTLYACGNNTMGSEENIHGSWIFVDGITDDDTAGALFNAFRGITLNFHSDGTWDSGDGGGAGIWSIHGDKLTLTNIAGGGISITWTYNIDGDRLSLSMQKTDFLNFLADSGSSSSEIDFFRQNLSTDFSFQVIFRRTHNN